MFLGAQEYIGNLRAYIEPTFFRSGLPECTFCQIDSLLCTILFHFKSKVTNQLKKSNSIVIMSSSTPKHFYISKVQTRVVCENSLRLFCFFFPFRQKNRFCSFSCWFKVVPVPWSQKHQTVRPPHSNTLRQGMFQTLLPALH